ncbi:MAG TPA: T9SS type A sorting domain-containing protein, partial [Flavobacterium sp.]
SNLSGEVGDVVTIRGKNFQNLVEISFNGVSTSLFQVNSDYTIATVTVPEYATTGLLGVKDSGEDTAFSATDFIMKPRITDFTPKKGPIGTSVTITGKNFIDVTQVAFNGVLAEFNVNPEGTEITALVPETTTGPILVTGPSGHDQSTIDFQVPIKINLSSFACSISSNHACAVYYDDNNINIGNYDFFQKYYRNRLYFGCSTSGSFFDFQNFEIAGVKLNKSIITGNGSTTTTFKLDESVGIDDASVQAEFMLIKNYLSGTGPKIITGTLANGVYFTATLPNHVNGSGISSGDNCITGTTTSSLSLQQAVPGLKELETAITAISLRPNPTNGDTTLDLPHPKEVTQVSIIDMAGRVLWKTTAVQAETVLPVAGFKTGTYLVTVGYKNSERETLKLVKQ